VAPNGSSIFDSFSFEIESFKLTPANGILVLAKIQNRTSGIPISVGLNYGLSEGNWHTLTYLVDDQGNTIPFSGSEGIVKMDNNNSGYSTFEGLKYFLSYPHQLSDFNKYWSQMVDIGPGQSVLVTLHFALSNGTLGSAFRLQCGIVCVQKLPADRISLDLNDVVIPDIHLKN
jgi:hypothetical protein